MAGNRQEFIRDRNKEKFEKFKKEKNINIPENVEELTSVKSYIKDNLLYIKTNGNCAGFQINLEGDCFIKPTFEYQENIYRLDLQNGVLLGISLSYNKKFEGAVLEFYGDVTIRGALFTGWQGEKIISKITTIKDTGEVQSINTPVEEMTTPIKHLTPNLTPKYHNKLSIQKGRHFFEWKAELLNDLQELNKVYVQDKTTKSRVKGRLKEEKIKPYSNTIAQLEKLDNRSFIGVSKKITPYLKSDNFKKEQIFEKIKTEMAKPPVKTSLIKTEKIGKNKK